VVPVTDIQHTPPTPAQVDRLIELLCPDIEKKQILEKAA